VQDELEELTEDSAEIKTKAPWQKEIWDIKKVIKVTFKSGFKSLNT
jgi:hypothetical protein